jgi:glutathione S-transferase
MTVQLIARSSSHYSRVVRLFAHELEVPYELVVVRDLTSLDIAPYDNPALKIPSLRMNGSTLFGTENVCRRLAELSTAGRNVLFPEHLTDDVARNAQEMVWHAMSAQVQMVMATFGKLPLDNPVFVKARTGFEGALRWLDENFARVQLPPHDLSLLEVGLFCLVEHLTFRKTVPVEPYSALAAFACEFGQRPSAAATAYRFD